MTDLETARNELRKAQDEARAVLTREHTAMELAQVRARLEKATRVYAEMIRGK